MKDSERPSFGVFTDYDACRGEALHLRRATATFPWRERLSGGPRNSFGPLGMGRA